MKKTANALIGIALAIFMLSTFGLLYQIAHQEQRIANIYKSGVLIKSIDLNQVKEVTYYGIGTNGEIHQLKEEELLIPKEESEYNIVCVMPGAISMHCSTCANRLCLHTGIITSSAYPITCLPNKVVIQIVGTNIKDEIDAIAQ